MSENHEDARRYMLDVVRGDARAQHSLGLLFEQGRGGLPQDEREAVRLFKLAAEQGLAAALCSLGAIYAHGGGGLAQDDHKAALLFELAADQGDASAQCDLGVFYEFGRGGVPRDDRKAARLFKLAAEKGIAVAQYNLGRFYQQGRGGLPQDAREAVRLFKLAADQGLSAAQAELKPRIFSRLFGGGVDQGRDAPKDEPEQRRQRESAERERLQVLREAQERQRQAAERSLHEQQDAERRRKAETLLSGTAKRSRKRGSSARCMSGGMNVDRALEILGIEAGSTEDDIHAAYNHLMKRVHPDVGGSAYFAMELNAARDELLKSRHRNLRHGFPATGG